MPKTFEELVSVEIDTLYRGALFLSAGDRERAEGLLLDTVRDAFRAFRSENPAPPRFAAWLEGRLVRRSVEGSDLPAPDDAPRPSRTVGSGRPGPSPDDVHRALVAVPPWGRAALWLVLVGRWRYGDAAEALGIEVDRLQDLLAYRAVMTAELGAGAVKENGAGEAGRGGG